MTEFQMTDRHDWFAEAAEALVRYLFSKAGFEVFGQSEWGADLAIRDRETNHWLRCEVRSSDCNSQAKQKSVAALAKIAELEAQVCMDVDLKFQVTFYKLTGGRRETKSCGGPATSHKFSTEKALTDWIRGNCHTALEQAL